MPVLENPRHERFAQELAKGISAEAAYAASGYKRDRGAASRLSSKVNIQARVAELLERGAARAEVTVEKIVAELAKIGFANMADYMRPNAAGDPYLDFSRLTREQAAALQEVTVEAFTEGRGEDKRDVRRVKFKLYDKRAALVDMGRHLSMFPTKVEMSGKDGGPIETRELSPLEAARRLAFVWAKGLRELQGEK